MTDQERVKLNRLALIFEMPENEIKEIIEACREYSLIADSEAYKDWCSMYDGIHREATFEQDCRNWFACVRWLNRRASKEQNVQASVATESDSSNKAD